MKGAFRVKAPAKTDEQSLKRVVLKIRSEMTKETAQFLLNIKSYFLVKANLTFPMICYNAKRKVCEDCEEPECDLAQGKWRKHVE